MEAFDSAAVFSSIDHGGRYAYGNQPHIARWNLARLGETLLPLLARDTEDEAAVKEAVAQVTEVIDAFPDWYARALLRGQRAKLGLLADAADATGADAGDAALAGDWLALLQAQAVDHTLAWRRLADAAQGDAPELQALFADGASLQAWLTRWRARCAQDDAAMATPDAAQARAQRMRQVNPWIIPRNHRVEEALAAASDDNDLAPFEQLLEAVQHPFDDEAPQRGRYAEPAPAEVTACYQTFCGT